MPSGGRHERALRTIKRLNDEGLRFGNDEDLRLAAAATRAAHELIVLYLAAYEVRRPQRQLFTPAKLERTLGGALLDEDEGRDGSARDIEFELLQAAKFRLGGVSVYAGEPDLRIRYGYEKVGVAAKRIRSLRDDQVVRHVKKAAEQISGSGLRGWIAINLDARFRSTSVIQSRESLFPAFDKIFDSVNETFRSQYENSDVLGFRLHGYTYGWQLVRIPTDADHRFQCMPITDSEACRSPWSERVAVLENLL
ncbi:hypothetical protein [Candidatus Palauibacter sp.]|uniref:hypothetical protein n=1 Tax=Candidatus Palauibacter sp. TaxID=3101350 RepID=UPI003B5CA16D